MFRGYNYVPSRKFLKSGTIVLVYILIKLCLNTCYNVLLLYENTNIVDLLYLHACHRVEGMLPGARQL